MRTSIGVALVLFAWPLAVHAQDDAEFEEAERVLGAPRPQGTWVLDDGLGEDAVPWDDYDPAYSYQPRGPVSLGLELRVSALPVESTTTSPRPQLELHGFLGIRYAPRSPWQMRIGIAVGWEPHESTNLGGGTFVTTSALYVRLRVQALSIDFGRNFGLRAGPDIGFQYAPSPGGGRVMVSAAGLAQLVVRTDDGRFEAGVHGGVQLTGVDRLERVNAFDPFSDPGGSSYVGDPVLGATVGYQF